MQVGVYAVGIMKTSVSIINALIVLIFQVSLYDKVSFGTITKCVDYTDVLMFKCPDKLV